MDRIDEILDFFKKEGIVISCLDITFDDNEDSQFSIWDISININPLEIYGNMYLEAEKLTCGEDSYLLEKFSKIEVAFFHELGHYCDLAYRFDFNPRTMIEESEKFDEVQEEMISIWRLIQNEAEFDECYKHAMKFYRSIGIEKVADDNARDLMKYYLENCK